MHILCVLLRCGVKIAAQFFLKRICRKLVSVEIVNYTHLWFNGGDFRINLVKFKSIFAINSTEVYLKIQIYKNRYILVFEIKNFNAHFFEISKI